MNERKAHAQSGFSLLELLMVFILIAVFTSLALMQFRQPRFDLERQSIAREFKVYLERARFDSVTRRAEGAQRATMVLNSATSFTARLDLNFDGRVDPFEVRNVSFTNRSNTQILVTDTLNYPVTITFDRRGHAIATDNTAAVIDPVFTICSECGLPSQGKSVITVSSSGTVAVTPEPLDLSTLPAPPITNPAPILNCYIYVGPGTDCPIQ
jgi:prepilin-type N-terminal cleavage/methylation domain-containing protein